MFVASKMSGESLPFVDQNKESAKIPEMLLECFVSIHCTSTCFYKHIIRVSHTKSNLASVVQSSIKNSKSFRFLNDLGASPIFSLK